MRIEQLQSFVEISRSKSISIAAENLYITQPALSHSMKLLEEEFDLPLFHRSSYGVSLTEEGQAILPAAEKLLQDMRRIEKQVGEIRMAKKGYPAEELRICTVPSVNDSVLASAFETIKNALPSARVVIQVINHSDLYSLPDLSHCDLFICANIEHTFDNAIKSSGLESKVAFIEGFSAVMNRHHPLAQRRVLDIRNLVDYGLIFHSYDFSVEKFSDKAVTGTMPSKPLNIVQRSDNPRVIMKKLLSSDSVFVTGNMLANIDYSLEKDLVTIPVKNFHCTCFCLFPHNTPHAQTIKQVIDIVRDTRLDLLSPC